MGKNDLNTTFGIIILKYTLTSHLFRVMGLILKSFTSPRSWYMCSRQLSILKHKRLMIVSSAVQKMWFSTSVTFTKSLSCILCTATATSVELQKIFSVSAIWPILTSLGSHCHTSKIGCLKASTVSCERWYYTSPTNTSTSNRRRREKTGGEKRGGRQKSGVLDSYLVGLPQPDVEGGFSEGIYGLLGEHVLQVTELSVNPR